VADSADTTTGGAGKSSGTQGVKDLVERIFLAGMGAAALTKERIQELVEELVSKGQMNAEEGREVVEKLAARSRDEARNVLKKADSSLHTAYRELGLGSKQEIEELALRVDQLEHRLGLLEQQADAGAKARP
jgi:polyhydroxyalkanoate synthesis regulator phasin